MTYEEARAEMLAISGEHWFSLEEVVPRRPLDYCKPYCEAVVATETSRGSTVKRGVGPNWKKAINALKMELEKGEAA